MYGAELAILDWLKKKAREGRAREDGDRTIFRVPLPAQFFLLSGVLVLIFVEILMFSVPDTPLWQEMVLVPILLFLLWCGPRSVILDATGISNRNFLGIRRMIPWHDVRTLHLATRKQNARVGTGTALRIDFTAFHVDLPRFVEEVRRRVPGVNFTSDL